MEQSFAFRGHRIHTGTVGNGPAIVVAHGTPWSSDTMRPLIDLLARDYRVHFYDMLGYGRSAKPEDDVSLGVQNELLNALIDHWHLDAPIAIGHDFGGATVVRAHLLNHRAFAAMILIDPVILTPWGSPFFVHVREHREAFEGLPGRLHRALLAEYVQTAAYRRLDSASIDAIVEPWMGDEGQPAFYRQIAQADETYTAEIVPQLTSVGARTLILWGEQDSWIPVERGYRLAHAIPGVVIRSVSEAGHLVVQEKPQELARAIREFCGR